MTGRLRRYYKCGRLFGKICCCVAVVAWLYWRLLEWWRPACSIPCAQDFPSPHIGQQEAKGEQRVKA